MTETDVDSKMNVRRANYNQQQWLETLKLVKNFALVKDDCYLNKIKQMILLQRTQL